MVRSCGLINFIVHGIAIALLLLLLEIESLFGRYPIVAYSRVELFE